MAKAVPHAENEINARDLRVTFSPQVREAFGDIAAIARLSEHFDSGMYEIVKDWSNGKRPSVHDVIIALPSIAGEVGRHIGATQDDRMTEAWDALCSQMPESGFKVSQSLQRRR